MNQRLSLKTFPFILITILFVLSACVPSGGAKKSKRKKKSTSGVSTNDNTIETTDPTLTNEISWYDGKYIDEIITINENYKTVLYIRGNSIHNFLATNSNYLKKYCLATSFNQNGGSGKDSFRARAIPQVITNFSTKTKERFFKIDIVDDSASESDCKNSLGETVNLYDNSNNQFGTSSAPSYLPSNICTTCSGIIPSLNISLYESVLGIDSKYGISNNSRVDYNLINFQGFGIRIDITNNTTSGESSCTDSACASQGFDCCIDGQCVEDGKMKPNPDADDKPFALADVLNSGNENAYKNWPSVYFVCGSNVSNDDDDDETTNTNPSDDAKIALDKEIEEYNCLEEGKKETPDYTTPSPQLCAPSFDDTSYKEIRKNVWIKCGCEAFPFPTDPEEPYCPDFGLKAIKDDSNTITDIVCDIPNDKAEAAPLQNLSLSISSRSAPHRFYDSGGVNYDDLAAITVSPKPTQEGEEFSYLDPSSKTSANPTKYSINAVLGQMDLDLSKALPAKMLEVEYDQTYIITALTGYYTPCSSCAKDSWYTAFSPYPTSQNGLGLRAVGYTTNRQQSSDNTTYGNYEDTIFGRACWLPPTMIPFGHKKDSNLITQRNNRLETQASLYINGLQRGWYGFNKGALIGSFDGTKWFAIGKGRRVTATSKKLFLAINAPFSDLADNTSINISIVTDLGVSIASDVDYDPTISPDDPVQNEGASCQRWHQCATDSECVSKLGWEYTCAEVDQFKTYLPKFDENADEVVNDEYEDVSFDDILHGANTISSQKRCVYRGAGSICKINYTSDGLTTDQQELFRCAPNFYCESLSGTNFNEELVRTPDNFSNILYGQDNDILGRPLNYNSKSGTGTLSQSTIDNIQYNAALYFDKNPLSSGASNFGICRPGKDISQLVWSNQHQVQDTLGRTDYISQISSCDSNALGSSRYSSCPTFDTTGDYSFDQDTLYNENRLQNMCGNSSRTENSGIFESTFKNIEEGPIGTFTSLFTKKVPQDACLRRAGAICHTNLDCSPNILHGDDAQFFDLTSFGDTEAELKFWQESLVCSQAQTKPLIQSEDYFDYDITKNRCCREIGKDLTMFTAGLSDAVPGNTDSEKLDLLQMIDPHPEAIGRYSRYTSIPDLESKTLTSSGQSPYPQIPYVFKGNTPQIYQWKTINDTGRRTCCGGGFIRKFADGSHNWKNSNKLSIAPENFSCLNYQSTLPFENAGGGDQDNYLSEYSKFCLSPGSGSGTLNFGCLQVPITAASGYEITPPQEYIGGTTTTATMSTLPDSDPSTGSGYTQFNRLSSTVPYMPAIFNNPTPIPILTSDHLNFFLDNTLAANYLVSFYLPVYINPNNITSVQAAYVLASGAVNRENLTQVACPAGWTNPSLLGDNQYCIGSNNLPDPYTNSGRLTVVHVKGAALSGGSNWSYGGVEIGFVPQNVNNGTNANPPALGAPFIAGNDMYYLTKLARLELSGIPQIFYEPIYCNSQRDQLVDGIYDTTATRAGFESNGYTYNGVNVTNKFLLDIYETATTTLDISNQAEEVIGTDKLSSPEIFSDHEFVCCQELGTTTLSDNLCCSNFSITDPSNANSKICALPKGTNLNVYFNRFVSGEGTTGDSPFTDDDFVPETGELKLNDTAYQKLVSFGVEYCENGSTRGGGAFGKFNPAPHGAAYFDGESVTEDQQKYYSIVDNQFDYNADDDSGYGAFMQGYKWNHHVYCN